MAPTRAKMTERTCDILTYNLYRGDAVSQHTFELARVLAAMGMRPAIYSNYPPRDLPDDIRPIARQASYASYVSHADLTLLQYPLWFPLAERFRTSSGARLFWYHGVTPPEHWPLPEERDLLRIAQIRTELANHAHLAVAASPFTASELHAHCAYPADRMRVVPIGVDTGRFAATPDPALLARLRRRWNLDGKRVLLYVGRVAGNKRIDVLIQALSHLVSDFPDLHLLVVGDDRSGVATQVLVRDLGRLAEELGVARHVTFAGRVPDVAPYYHLAEAFVQASQHEGFGVPLVEAMATSVPVVASAASAMPWLLQAEASIAHVDITAAGLLFEPGNAQQLAERIAELLSRPDLRSQLAARGRRRAEDFDLQAFRVRAALIICEAIELHAAGVPVPETTYVRADLYRRADTVDRDYSVTSPLPLIGGQIAEVRKAATVHLKEAWFDRVMEQQVSFNRALAASIGNLDRELEDAATTLAQTARRP